MFDKKSLIELLKSIARFVYFGLWGVLLVIIIALIASPQVVGLTIDIFGVSISLGSTIVATGGLIAKAIDLYIRKAQNIDANGIAPGFLQK